MRKFWCFMMVILAVCGSVAMVAENVTARPSVSVTDPSPTEEPAGWTPFDPSDPYYTHAATEDRDIELTISWADLPELGDGECYYLDVYIKYYDSLGFWEPITSNPNFRHQSNLTGDTYTWTQTFPAYVPDAQFGNGPPWNVYYGSYRVQMYTKVVWHHFVGGLPVDTVVLSTGACNLLYIQEVL